MTPSDSSASAGGASTWGDFDVWSSGNARTHHLVVLPPGTTAAEARVFRCATEYPWIGVAGAELLFALTAGALGPLAGAAIGACCFIAGLVLVRRLSARTRAGARALTAGGSDRHGSEARRLADRLAEADAALRESRIDPVAHEVVWCETWQRIGSPSFGAPIGLASTSQGRRST